MAESADQLNRPTAGRRYATGKPEEIRAHIEQTRAQMGHTIDQIQNRLSPERLKQETKEAVRDATIGKVEEMTDQAEREMRSWRTRAVRTVKQNPVPMALIGIGLGWLLATDNEDDYQYYDVDPRERYPYPASRGTYDEDYDTRDLTDEGRDWAREKARRVEERTQRAAHSVRERAEDVTESVQESVGTAAHRAERRAQEVGHRIDRGTDEAQRRARETAAEVQQRARRGVRRTKRTFWHNMNENPLAMGAAAMTVGALVGLALPGTTHEDEWVGHRRDELVETARTRVAETSQDVRAVAREAKDAAVETAKEEADKRDLTPATDTDTKEKSTQTATATTTTASTS